MSRKVPSQTKTKELLTPLTMTTAPGADQPTSATSVTEAMIQTVELSRIYPNDVQGSEKVSGNDAAKMAVAERVILPFSLPQAAADEYIGGGGVLFAGSPGTGKTMMAFSVAKAERISFYSIDGASLIDKYYGSGERNIANVFAVASLKAPSVIFIDEIHSLCGTQDASSHEATKRMMGQMLICMTKYPKVFVIGASSFPWSIDRNMVRRFQVRVHFTLPDEAARKELFQSKMKGRYHSCTQADFQKMAELSEGLTGDIINTLIGNVVRQAWMEVMRATHFKEVISDETPIYIPSNFHSGIPGEQVESVKRGPAIAAKALLDSIRASRGEVKALKEAEVHYDRWTKAPFYESQ